MPMNGKKVVVAGIDGATFDVIAPLVEEGALPNFGRMLRTGVHGKLRSTIPALSPVAWTSFMTGKNPGKHGIFDFVARRPGSYDVAMNNARNRKAKPLWTILSEQGRKVCVTGVTLTYPPDDVNGYMVSGLGRPMSGPSTWTTPPGLAEEIGKNVGEYVIIYPIPLHKFNESDKVKDQYLGHVLASFDYQMKLFRYLQEKGTFDFSMLFFLDTDGISHHYWRHFDPGHRLFRDGKYRNVVRAVYERIDAKMGELLDLCGDETDLVAVSDHGFGPLNRILHLNGWLAREGYLRIRKTSFVSRQIDRLLRREPDSIDWSRTRAYFKGTSGNVAINLAGREPSGIVAKGDYESLRDELVSRLEKIVDPETGEAPIEKAYRREEIYSGEHVENAPDIVVTFRRGYDVMGEEIRPRALREAGPVFTDCRRWSGRHEPDGILVARGPSFRKGGKIDGAAIGDIAPSILYLLDVPIPEGTDGRVLEGLFDEKLLSSRGIAYSGHAGESEKRPSAPDKSETDQMMEQLRNLGYIE